jgi:hypothetical protein
LVEQITQQIHQKLEWARKAVHWQFQFNIHMTSIDQRTQVLHTKKRRLVTLVYIALEHNKKLSRRRLWGASSRCLHTQAPPFRLCRGDGKDQT